MADDQSNPRSKGGLLVAVIILLTGIVLELVGHNVSAGYGEVLREAGFVVIGTVLATYVYEYVLRKQHDVHLIGLVEQSLIPGARRFGLVHIHRRLRFDELFNQLQAGDELLWLDTYCPDQPNYQTHLRSAIGRGATVKMLAVKPDCHVARLRASEINPDHGYSNERFRNEADNNLEHLRDALEFLSSEARSHVVVRLYEDLPCIPAYIHVRGGRPYVAYTSYFLRDPSFNKPHLEWRAASGGMLQDLYDYFIAKWLVNEPYQIDLSARPKIVITKTRQPED